MEKPSARPWTAAALVVLFAVAAAEAPAPAPRRILVDTDMDTDDLFALLYILKQDRSQFDVKVSAICHVRRPSSIYP
jgi:hypothetical protein